MVSDPLEKPGVPFFRPQIGREEMEEVMQCLRTGWLTSGPLKRRFEVEFAAFVGASHAVALNSCTAALHLAVEALGLREGELVLVPSLTFAATVEVILYKGARPLFVDCDPTTLNMNLGDAERKVVEWKSSHEDKAGGGRVVGVMPVHVGGFMLDMRSVNEFAAKHGLWVVEDAAHALPAAFITSDGEMLRCGCATADVTCFSFYANKTITTGEGGMAVTENEGLAQKIESLSLHGLSKTAWKRFGGGSWDYHIVEPGYKYNLTDIAAAIGIHQLAKAETFRQKRESIAGQFFSGLSGCDEIELPCQSDDRLHSWHLFPIKLRLERLRIERNEFIEELRKRGIACSVHWRPVHMHPYYEKMDYPGSRDLRNTEAVWPRLVSLPIFPDMTERERRAVIDGVAEVCDRFGR